MDPDGVTHELIDYPGVPVDHSTISKNTDVLEGVRIPVRPHFGTLEVVPREADFVYSIPPGYFGGNIDNWRIGKGGAIYYPVAVEGALLSAGDPHAVQGDSELAGTAIETSMTGLVQVVLHKADDTPGSPLEGLDYPLLETDTEWVVNGFSYSNYLDELGNTAQCDIYSKSSIENAMRDAFRKMRGFLMTTQNLSEDEAISLMSVAADFGGTQVVDGNWGVHAIIKKQVLPEYGFLIGVSTCHSTGVRHQGRCTSPLGWVLSSHLKDDELVENTASTLVEIDLALIVLVKDMRLHVVQVQQCLTDISATRGLDDLDDEFVEAENGANAFKSDARKVVAIAGLHGLKEIEKDTRLALAVFPNYYSSGIRMDRATEAHWRVRLSKRLWI